MKFFACLFLCAFTLGLWLGSYGPALISLGMLLVVYAGNKVFAKQDAVYYNSPASAATPPDTLALLAKEGCESSSDKSPFSILKVDLEI